LFIEISKASGADYQPVIKNVANSEIRIITVDDDYNVTEYHEN